MKLISLLATTVAAIVLGGCSGSRLYSVDVVNETDQPVQMQVREGKGGTADPVLFTRTTARAEHFTWSGKTTEGAYFRAVRLEGDQPAGSPAELALVAGTPLTAAVRTEAGQIAIAPVESKRYRQERPEDVVPRPDRLPSNPRR